MILKARKFINPPYSFKEIFSLICIVVVVGAALLIFAFNQRSSATMAETPPLRYTDTKIAEKNTLRILELKAQIAKSNAASAASKKTKLANLARAREKVLSELVETKPEEVLRLAIPNSISKDLPTSAKDKLERQVAVKGEVEALGVDDFKGGESETKLFLRSGKKRYQLQPTKETADIRPESNVKISGVTVGKTLVFNPEKTEDLKVLPASDTTGDQKVVVILANFLDNTSQPFTPAYASSVVFGPVNSYYQEASFGKASLSGDVFGWYTLPINQTCTYSTIQSQAIAAADPYVNFKNYSRIVIGFPISGSCGWAGMGSVGKWNVSTADGSVRASLAWIVGSYFSLGVIGHEMGHNFGVWHANALECSTESIGDSCSTVDYGDPYNIMGNISNGHFDTYHKEYFNWFDPGNVRLVTTDTVVSIEPIENSSAGVLGVKIPRDKDGSGNPLNYLYLEYRKQTGYDSSLLGNVYNGALIHWAPVYAGTGDTHLVDTTPNSASGSLDRRDGALEVGRKFTDSDANIEVTTLSRTTSDITLDIKTGTPSCVRANPTVTVDPESAFAQPGATLTYTVTVTNNDNSACGPSDFTMSALSPASWGSDFSTSTLSISSGETADTSLNVTSAASAVDGYYDITITATNSSSSSYKASATATYVVSNDIENPTVSITSPMNGETVSGMVTVRANATDDTGVTKVDFYVGISKKATDTSEPYEFAWNTTQSQNGTYLLHAVAFDASGKYSQSSVSVIVSNQDGEKPTVPSNLHATQISESQVNLSWNASTDNVVVGGYKIYRNGNLLASSGTNSYADMTVSLENTYTYAVSAFDGVGNESDRSTVLTVTVKDLTRPSTPTGLRAKAQSSSKLALSWNASTDNVGVIGYKVYRNSTLIKLSLSRYYTDTSVRAGKTYNYQVAAFDVRGNTSLRSSSVRVTIPGTGTQAGKLGDINRDSRIDIRDLSILLSRWKTTYQSADLNTDGKVDIRDLSILLSRWGR